MIWCLPYTICGLYAWFLNIYIYILANEEILGNCCVFLQSIFNFTFHQLSQLFFLSSAFFVAFVYLTAIWNFLYVEPFSLSSLWCLSLALLKFVFMEALGIVVLGLIDKDILVATVVVDRVVSFARHSASASGLVNFNVFAFVLFCRHHIFLSLCVCACVLVKIMYIFSTFACFVFAYRVWRSFA